MRTRILLGAILAAVPSFADEPGANPLKVPDPVVCSTIEGFRNFEKRDPPELTKDEKLLVYYEPRGYAVVRDGDVSKIHLTQDAKVYRRGEPKPLWGKTDMVVYKVETRERPGQVFMRNTIEVKQLKPGDYELEILLRDRLADASAPRVAQRVGFRVVEAQPD